MYQNLKTASTMDVTGWERHFCRTDWCPILTVYAQRYEHEHEAWRVTPNPDESGWLVASIGPVCPICGGILMTASNVDEGAEIVERFHLMDEFVR